MREAQEERREVMLGRGKGKEERLAVDQLTGQLTVVARGRGEKERREKERASGVWPLANEPE